MVNTKISTTYDNVHVLIIINIESTEMSVNGEFPNQT